MAGSLVWSMEFEAEILYTEFKIGFRVRFEVNKSELNRTQTRILCFRMQAKLAYNNKNVIYFTYVIFDPGILKGSLALENGSLYDCL